MKSLVDLERIPENFSSEQSLKLQQQAKKGKNGNVLHLYAYRQNKTKLKRMLSEQKYEINKKDKMGNTPLHIACFTGGPKIFKALLKHGADIQATNKNKETPLDLAMLSNYDKIKKKLVEINAPHNTDISKLQMHIIRGENSQALEMINDPKHRGLITRADKLGNLPIHEAACYGMKDCLLALLQHNSPVDPINIDKRTPFYLSCLNSQLECAKLLADHGADLQKRNIYGTQAIHTAVSKQCKDDNILAFLLQKNVDPDSRDGEGMTPLHLATNPERVKMLLHFHADFNTLDSFEFLPVQYMARKGAFFSLQVLVEHGAQIISGEMGFPPAHLAARKGHHKCLDYILQIAKKRDQMFDVCDGWFFENSLIAMTVINNHPKCLRVVLGHSDPGIVSAPEAKKTNFIYLAMKHNRAECANILIESGYPKPPLSKKEINKLSAEFRYLLLGDFSFSKDFEWLFTSGSFFSDLSVVVNDQTGILSPLLRSPRKTRKARNPHSSSTLQRRSSPRCVPSPILHIHRRSFAIQNFPQKNQKAQAYRP
ncbi:molting protein mlt-4 [Anaeramoeba ignava]|uniref:Molting protein mlt-4 n=1 Tax=Anaeramoeba ignava TaxID=1746090 RepID=A0A9Q0REJ5_ANAIG|nr:molting protein mlt-4 [Anaeramoeba ignava]